VVWHPRHTGLLVGSPPIPDSVFGEAPGAELVGAYGLVVARPASSLSDIHPLGGGLTVRPPADREGDEDGEEEPSGQDEGSLAVITWFTCTPSKVCTFPLGHRISIRSI